MQSFAYLQVDRVYLSSPNVIAVLDHEKKRTFVIRKEGLPDVGKTLFIGYSLLPFHILIQSLDFILIYL